MAPKSAAQLWNPRVELMSDKEISDMQLHKLKRQLERLDEVSPYYREKFKRAGVKPSKLKSLDEFAEYPFFDKEEERLSQERSLEEEGHPFGTHLSVDPQEINRVSASSGTTGRPTYTAYSRRDRWWGNENGARAWRRIGIETGETVMHSMVLSMWIAGVPLLEMLLEYGANAVPIGVLSGSERWGQVAKDLRPTTVICTPSFAELLSKVVPERCGYDVSELGIKRLVVTGEPGGSVPRIYEALEKQFGGATVYDITGATGAHSPTSISCEMHAGMHFYAHDSCLMEIVDPVTLKPLPWEDGVEGEVVVTGLEKECAPMIRFREKDRIRLTTQPCECGRPGPRWWILGRIDDMLLVKGVNVFPSAVREVVLEFAPRVSGNMRIYKDNEGPVVQPPVAIDVEYAGHPTAEELQELSSRISRAIQNKLRFQADVDLVPEGTLGTKTGATHKLRLVEVRGN